MDISITLSIIQNFCKEQNISIDKMLKECGLKKSVIDNMKKGSIPSADKVLSIAQFFNVSVEYLLTGKEKNTSLALSKEEQECIEKFRRLDEFDRVRVLERVEVLLEKYDTDIPTAARTNNGCTTEIVNKPDVEKLDNAKPRKY